MVEGPKFFENIKKSTKAPSRILQSEDLLQGEREILIQHGDRQYRLISTKSGKLILNK
jgi:hemin uptake protein HemP